MSTRQRLGLAIEQLRNLQQFSHLSHALIDLYYTRSWNYSFDDVERGFTGLAYADVNNIRSEYNYSNIDEPHQFRGTVNYLLPLGFEFNSTMKFTAGRPFTARAGTTDLNGDGQTNDRPIVDGVMFKRNSFRNSGFRDVALRVQKNVTVPSGVLSVSLEVFNLLKNANEYADPRTQAILSSPNFRVNNQTLGPRLAQLGVRLDF